MYSVTNVNHAQYAVGSIFSLFGRISVLGWLRNLALRDQSVGQYCSPFVEFKPLELFERVDQSRWSLKDDVCHARTA
jgi:hypothetical protein